MGTLKIGSMYRIQNRYNFDSNGEWSGGWLDTRGSGCKSNFLCVSTANCYDREPQSGSWIIQSDTKKPGDPIQDGDCIHLQNQFAYDPDVKGGWLDTRGGGCQENFLCVSTATSKTRDGLSGSWKVMKIDNLQDPYIYEGDAVRLLNGYYDFAGGYLDTRMPEGDNLLSVSTSKTEDRDAGSTHWRFLEQREIYSSIFTAYNNIPADGTGHKNHGWINSLVNCDGFSGISNHCQGLAIYDKYLIITHNALDTQQDGRGYIVIVDTSIDTITHAMRTSEPALNHPGGCQQHGGVLAVSAENGDDQSPNKSVINFYSLDALLYQGTPNLLGAKIIRNDRKAGAVGLTSRVLDSKVIYYVAVYDGATGIDVYVSNGWPFDSEGCAFTLKFNMKTRYGIGADNFNIFADPGSNFIYVLGMRSTGAEFNDKVDIYAFDPDAPPEYLELITSRHFITHGDTVGFEGAHFRYAAGANLESGSFRLSSAGRGINAQSGDWGFNLIDVTTEHFS